MAHRGVCQVVLIAVAACLSFGTAPAHASFPGANGRIAVSRAYFLDGPPDVWTVNPDGTGATLLTTTGNGADPAWSPDGSKIAFWVDAQFDEFPHGYDDIWVMNADGSGKTKLTSTLNNIQPAWSPDGTKIAFVSRRDGNDEIYTMNADGTAQTRITNTAADRETRPAWSPDGATIAFSLWSSTTNTEGIHTMNPDGSGAINLTTVHVGPCTGAFSCSGPSWSPDGSRIAFTDNDDIWVMSRDGTDKTQITSNSNFLYAFPTWSPDGRKFVAWKYNLNLDTPDIVTMNTDGTGETGVAWADPDPTDKPDWQPIPSVVPEPQPSDYKNAAQFCKADRSFLGGAAFRQKYRGGPNAFATCVRQNRRKAAG